MVTSIARLLQRKHPVARLRGQGTVEFALISLTLLMLTFGLIDFGRAVFARSMLTNAVREAARAGSVYERSTDTVPASVSGQYNCGTNTRANGQVVDTLCKVVVDAAARTSPSLGLATSNFCSGVTPGTSTCTTTGTGTGQVACTRWADTGNGGWDNCREGLTTVPTNPPPTTSMNDKLTVCAEYQFGLTAPRLVRLNSINMRECARVSLQ